MRRYLNIINFNMTENKLVLEVLESAINYALCNYQLSDAVFLAERLHDEVKSVHTAFLLATCYYRSGRTQQARHLLIGHKMSPQCQLLYARCCLDLKEYREGLTHLQGLLCVRGETNYDDIIKRFGKDAGVAFCLLGELNRKLHLINEASCCYKFALKQNPFLWSAFECLCQLGVETNPYEYFNVTEIPSFLREQQWKDKGKHDVPKSMKINVCQSIITPSDRTSGDYITPDLFGAPSIGVAVDSSTPSSPRMLLIGGMGADPSMKIPTLCFDSDHPVRNMSPLLPPFSSSNNDPLETPQQALMATPTSAQLSNNENFSYHAPRSIKQRTTNIPSIARHSLHATFTPETRPSDPEGLHSYQQSMDVGDTTDTHLCTPNNLLTTPTMQSHDSPSTPDMSHLSSIPPPPPPRSMHLRRSTRIGGSGIGKSPSSLSISRHRTEVIPSALTASRSKSQLKMATGKSHIPKTTSKKQRVTFMKNLTSPQKPHPLSQLHENEDPRQKEEDMKFIDEEKMESSTQINQHPINDKNTLLAISVVMKLLQMFGSSYQCLQNYELKESVKHFHNLPSKHRNSLWVLTQLGQAMMSGEKFKEAARYYERVHSIDPHRQEGMDQYGSALWHLQRENDLSSLVEDLQSSDKMRPEGLCAMSSLMNLYKEHDAAIKYLERAVQISPDYVYAQTLLGLENTLIKNYDKALLGFQSATSIDPRHFNAWYGMAHLYYQQEKWKMAEICSKRALSINCSSSVGYTQLALILQQQGKLKDALSTVNHAVSLNTSNNLPKFHRALIQESIGKYDESLAQLEELTLSLPKEPLFYKTMSRVLVKLGRPHDSVLHLAWALDYSHSAGGIVGGSVVMNERGRSEGLPMEQFISDLEEDDFIPHPDIMSSSDSDED